MKRLSDEQLEAEIKNFREFQKQQQNSRMFGRDLKNLFMCGPSKQSAGARKKGIIVNKSASTNQLHQNKNRNKISLCHKDNYIQSIEQKKNNARMQTQTANTINFKLNKNSKKSIQQADIPIQTIKQYLKNKAPKAPSQINNNHNVSISMRKILVSWIIELTHVLRFRPQTLFHTVHIFDLMLQTKISQFNLEIEKFNPQKIDICIQNLQLLAIACILISSKYQQINPPPLKKFLEFAEYYYSKNKLVQMESKILLQNDFSLTFPTRYTFIQNYIDSYHCYSKEKQNRLAHMCQYLCTISLLELWDEVNEDELAEAIFFLSKKVLGCQNPPPLDSRKKINRKIYSVAWRLKQVWNNNYGGIVSYIFDSDKYSFVGGVYIKEK